MPVTVGRDRLTTSHLRAVSSSFERQQQLRRQPDLATHQRMTLVIIFGPPAVGKMTVGLALERLTGFRLFHNHMTVDPVIRLFPFESPAYRRLVQEFRR